MNIAAGVLGLAFALVHGLPSLSGFKQPVAARGSGERGAIPIWARLLWFVLVLVTLAGSIVHLISSTTGSAVLIAIGAAGIWALAIANGFWIHGRPTVSHHLIRGVIVVLLLVLAFIDLK